jgi:hypothetical protein
MVEQFRWRINQIRVRLNIDECSIKIEQEGVRLTGNLHP